MRRGRRGSIDSSGTDGDTVVGMAASESGDGGGGVLGTAISLAMLARVLVER
jgi:hypothetical protein